MNENLLNIYALFHKNQWCTCLFLCKLSHIIFIEVILNQELGEPFRRDAMKKPVRVAGIKKEDMKKQPSLT